jgi:hypothetical protein
MIEEITYQVGACPENAWRRNNLLAVHHCEDKGSFHEVSFQYVEHTSNGVKQVRLIYQIIK